MPGSTGRGPIAIAFGTPGRSSPIFWLPPMHPLHLEVAPLSPEELDYPAIRIMHAASSLESPDDAAEWRGATPEAPLPPATGEIFSLCPDTAASLPSAALEDVIRRRGSTRRFSHQPLSLAQLSNV